MHVPEQFRLELAVARREVERIYRYRRRFVEKLKSVLEEQQDVHENLTGERRAWAGDLGRRLARDDSGIDELVVFVRAMVTRARLAAVTAGSLADADAPVAAVRLLDKVENEIREDYSDLQRRLSALARSRPDEPLWRKLLDRNDAERAVASIKVLEEVLRCEVGGRLPEREAPVTLDLV